MSKGTRQEHLISPVPELVEGKKKCPYPNPFSRREPTAPRREKGRVLPCYPSASSGTILLFQFLYILICITHHIKNNNLRDQRQRLTEEKMGEFYLAPLWQVQGPFYYFFFLTSFSALRTILNLTIFVINAYEIVWSSVRVHSSTIWLLRSLSLSKGTRQDHSSSSVPELVKGKKMRSSPTQILDGSQRLHVEETGDFYFTTLRQAQGPFYYFFFLTSFSALRTILNLTILVISAKGIGSSSGNWTEPFPCLYFDNSFWKDSIPVGVG